MGSVKTSSKRRSLRPSRGEGSESSTSCLSRLARRKSLPQVLAEQGFAGDALQRPVRRSRSCSIPIADGKDSEDILGSAANLNSKGRGDKSLPTKLRTERRR